ncbi:hypothetical protein BGW42_002567 [Actinomortierella wolfii]|nr:hypothetical protein BGW42_002567 [Actinomortierella wolfii]
MQTLLRHKDDPNSFAAEKLLILVLRYSPAQDADVLDLRLMFSDELAKLPLIPTTNYLAHIKTMSFCMELFGTYSNLAQKARASFPCDRRVYNLRLYATLVWAACGHQLAKIQDIHIPCRDIARYFAHIPKMARMRSIRLFLHDVADPSLRSWKPIEIESVRLDLEATFNFVALWKTKTAATARQECNNNNSNNNGIITDKKLYTDLRLVWSGEATFERPLDPFSGDLLRIFHQMPLLRTSKITCHERLQWARFQLAPETIDLPNVSTIEARVEGKQHWSWPQEGITSVLYQCRALRCLELSLQDGDENIFAWVVNQKRKADVSHHPLRRLEELTLDIRGTGSWVQDALTAFGSQLKVLNIASWSNYSLDLALINGLCELRELHVDVGKMVNSGNVRPFSGCPCLWRIQLAHSVFNDKSLDLFDLSAVTDLTLRGPSAVQFQQSSLSSMVKARRIVVQVDQRSDLDEVPLPFYWERTSSSLLAGQH